MSMRLTLAGTLIAALASSACSDSSAPANAVKYNMSWLPQGSQIGVITAIDKGFYKAAGIEVEPVRGFGGIRTVNEIDQGMFEFGYGDPVAVALNRANGGGARMIGIINQRWPAGLCFIPERHHLSQPADLKGLKVGGGQNSPVQALLPVWLGRNGVDPKTVQILQLNPSVIVASLIEGKIDAAECWRGNSYPQFQMEARRAGLGLDWLEYAKFNLDIYGSGLVTSDRLIHENPGLVRKFAAATLKGYRYAIDHPAEARQMLLAHFPMLNPDITDAQIHDLAGLMQAPGDSGSIDPGKMERTYAFIAAGYPLKGKVAAGDLYAPGFTVDEHRKSGATP